VGSLLSYPPVVAQLPLLLPDAAHLTLVSSQELQVPVPNVAGPDPGFWISKIYSWREQILVFTNNNTVFEGLFLPAALRSTVQ